MPTINQLVRQGRKSKSTKSDSPALNFGYNSKKRALPVIQHRKNVGLLLVSVP